MKPPGPIRVSPGQADQARLVERAQSGDVGAFEALVAAHSDRAYGLAFRILRSAPDAEETTQDAFVRAWNALPRFRGDAVFGTWLHQIVLRCALDRRVRLRARAARETNLETDHASAAPDSTTDVADRLRLERHMATLPETQRTVLTLYYLHDRSVVDVAQVLELNENTVKTHLRRGRAALRRAWDAEDAG